MAFIGNNLGSITTEARTVDTMVGDGSTATLTLTKTPGSVNNVEVFYDGIFQTPGEDFTLAGSTLTFTTTPTTGINVVAISGDDSQVVFPDANSITTKKILDNTITSDKFVDIAVEKLSGTLPALDGTAVTGMNLPDAVDLTNSASNPTRTMNKPVGSLAVNSTSGEMFILTDDETDNNTWMNVGLGNTDIVYTPPLPFGGLGGGTIEGYVVGGHQGSQNIIKFSIPSDSNSAVDTNRDLSVARNSHAGHSSATHGYVSGGANMASPAVFQTNTERWSFTTSANASDWSDLQVAVNAPIGSNDQTHGYTMGGTPNYPTPSNYIDKFSFSSQATASSHGVLARSVFWCGSMASYTNIYVAGSWTNLSGSNGVDKFAFASNTTATTVYSLASNKAHPNGYSSVTDGYIAGGHNGSGSTGTIDKISFSSDTITNGHGNLYTARQSAASISSTTAGYAAGGSTNNGADYSREKYIFSSEAVSYYAADIGEVKHSCSGSQY